MPGKFSLSILSSPPLTLGSYCASPMSGQGTTLAFSGAYTLAGELTRHPNDPAAAFDSYQEKMRPIVTKCQKLAPGLFIILMPDTAWAIWAIFTTLRILALSGIFKLLFILMGPKSEDLSVEDYRFQDLPEWTEGIDGASGTRND